MSTFTENYSLIKPDETDYYDVQDFNENMDMIDAQLAQTESAMESISEKIGTPSDTGSDTLFGKLSGGGSLIKSIQVVDFNTTFDGSTKTAEIQTVDPSKCIVLMDRLHDNSTGFTGAVYTLEPSQVTLTVGKHANSQYSIYVRLQIIEFY